MENDLIGELRSLIAKKDLTLEQISADTNVSYGIVWKFMRGGGSNFNLTTLDRLGSIVNRKLKLGRM